MSRKEVEAKLMEHMKAMVAILLEYNPDSTFLAASWLKDETGTNTSVWNAYFDLEKPDSDTPINCFMLDDGELRSIV